MALPPYKLNDEALISKARRTIEKIEATEYQKDVLSSLVNRFNYILGNMESTNHWAQGAFDEIDRLRELISDRWKPE